MNFLLQILLTLYLAMPVAAWAQAVPAKDPWSYPLRQYGLMLGTALLGGFVSWYAKVRKGEIAAYNVMQLIGELSTSAFAGLLAFWGCEAMSLSPLITASLVGIAGHMGTRAIQWGEEFAAKRFGQPTSNATAATTKEGDQP